MRPAERRLSDVLKWGRDKLRATPTDTPELDAQVLLGHVAVKTRAALLTHPEQPLTGAQHSRFERAIMRRARGEPVAYITGTKEFFGIDLVVDRRVLIPRPETETLVERALEACGEGGCVVADVGTGSGAIALAIALNRPMAHVYATDTSGDALAVARANAARVLGRAWEERLTLLHGALLQPIAEKVDVVCANLPYIPTGELTALPASVRDYEPWSALDGGPDGLDPYRALLADVDTQLARPGTLLMECDPRQAETLLELALTALPGARGEIVPDLAGAARVVEVRR